MHLGRVIPADKSVDFFLAGVSTWRLLRNHHIDLVYFPDYSLWRPSALVGARMAKVPGVVHLRAPISSGHARDPWLRSVRTIIGNSQATLQAMQSQAPAGKLQVVYNCVDFGQFAPKSQDQSVAFPGESPLVGFVGIFRPEKGIEYFLEMAKLLHRSDPTLRFVAVGGESLVQDRGWLDKMKQHAERLGLADVVRFTGPRSDIPEIMRSLTVLVVPSLNEGFGRVIIEANAVGTPVVGADTGGIPEVIEEGITGRLVPPKDPEAMAEVVKEILSSPDWRARVEATAPQRVRERFSPTAQVRKIEEIWNRALA